MDSVRGPGSRIASTLARLGGSLMIALATGELLTRCFLSVPLVETDGVVGVPVTVDTAPQESQGGRGRVTDLYLQTAKGLRYRPNARVTIQSHPLYPAGAVDFRTNELGYRGPPLRPRAEGVRRLLLLGDSITVSEYLPEERTFARLLESRWPGVPGSLEVLDAAVNGFGTQDEVDVLKESGLQTRPDVVMIVVFLNDTATSPALPIVRLPWPLSLSRFLTYVANAGARIRRSATGPLVGGVAPEKVARWAEEVNTLYPLTVSDPAQREFNRKIHALMGDWGIAYSPSVWKHLRPAFEEFAALARTAQFYPVIVITPAVAQLEATVAVDAPQRELARIARELGVPFLDLLPLLKARHRPADPALFLDQCHYTTEGNRLVAELLLEYLTAVPGFRAGAWDPAAWQRGAPAPAASGRGP